MPDRLHLLRRGFTMAHELWPRGGLCLEFGVREGTSFLWMAEMLLRTNRNSSLVGFDSWQGLPEEADGVWRPERHRAGMFKTPKEVVVRQLERLCGGDVPSRIRLVDGFFADSLTAALRETLPAPLIFVNFDCDLYLSTAQALQFVTPLLRRNTILYFDDWSEAEHSAPWGEHLAYQEWSESHDVACKTMAIADHGRRVLKVTDVGLVEQRSAAIP